MNFPIDRNPTERSQKPNPRGKMNDHGDEARMLAWVQLHCLGVRAQRVPEIISAGGPEICLADGLAGLRPWVTAKRWQTLSCDVGIWTRSAAWTQEIGQFGRAGGLILTPDFPAWRHRVKSGHAFPLCVYARGNLECFHVAPRVGVVGSRRPTDRAANRAHRFAHALSTAGAMVCSGGAWGIDLAAHRGALAAGGGTIAVLGEPLQPLADERPKRLRDWDERGLVLTPHGPWVPMSGHLFASRNQWIAALCDAVIVIEGAARSGTAHTARAAARFGVPIFAVPGDPDAPNSDTPNRMIAEGAAKPLLRIETLIARLGLQAVPTLNQARGKGTPEQQNGDVTQDCTIGHARSEMDGIRSLCPLEQLLAKGAPLSLERAAQDLGKGVPELMQISMMLELAGRVRRVGNQLHLLPGAGRTT